MPESAKLQDRIEVSMSPELKDDQCVATAKLVDGRTVDVRIEHATGSVDRPMTSAQIDAKFRALAGAMNSKRARGAAFGDVPARHGAG